MLSSAIPARLEFQCGHAALVSLPRIKGESTTQRNARVAREKLGAQTRACDFCGPVLVETLAPLALADALVAEADALVAEADAPVADVDALLAEADALIAEAMPAIIPAALAADDSAVAAPGVPAAEPAAHVEPTVVESSPVDVPPPQPPRRRAAARNGVAPRNGLAALRAYRVSYRVERVVRAVDIRDALRQAESLGSGDLVAITSDT